MTTSETYVVIPVKDRHALTSALLTELAKDSSAYREILIYDNRSTLPVQDTMLPSIAPRTKIIAFAGTGVINAMWNNGADRALAAANGKEHNVVYLNNDLEIGKHFLSRINTCLRSADDVGIVYPNFDNRSTVPGLLQETEGIAPDGGMSGFAFAIRGELQLRVNPLFRWWCGDADLEIKTRSLGYKVCCATHVYIKHLEPYRSTAENPVLAQLASEDRQRFLKIHNVPDVKKSG